MFRHWFGRPSRQNLQAPHGRLGDTATSWPLVKPVSPAILDKGRNLMAKDHRFAQPHRAKAAVVVVMQVRPAHPTRRQPQAQLARTGGLLGPVLDPQIASRRE